MSDFLFEAPRSLERALNPAEGARFELAKGFLP